MTRKITIPMTVELDDDDEVHNAAFDAVLAASVDEQSALEELGEIAGQEIDAKSLIYAKHRELESKRGQVSQQLGGGGIPGTGQPAED